MPSKILINIIQYFFHIYLICRTEDRGIMGPSTALKMDFYFLSNIQTGYAFYTFSYVLGTRVPLFGGKLAKE
jgi:hypothetical protein